MIWRGLSGWAGASTMLLMMTASVPGPPTGLARKSGTPADTLQVGRLAAQGVTVEFALMDPAGNRPRLCGRFAPTRPGFHLYAMELPEDGIRGIGRPTRLSIKEPSRFKSMGTATADRATQTLTVAPLGLTFPVYPAGPVTLCLPLEIGSDASAPVDALVTYMACSEQVCMAPVVDRLVRLTIDRRAGFGVQEK